MLNNPQHSTYKPSWVKEVSQNRNQPLGWSGFQSIFWL